MFVVVCVSIIFMAAGNGVVAQNRQGGIAVRAMANWKIVASAHAIPSEAYAAEELQTFFKQATGMRLPITTDPGDAACIYVGPSRAMAASALGFDTSAFGPEELRVVVGERAIAVAGGRPRGTLYGVYTFVEDCLGVRFLTPDTTHVPRLAQDSVLRPVDRRFNPHFSLRFYGSGEIHRERVLAWADTLYATLPQVDYEPDDDRWSLIPATIKKLQDGETLRIVILGDSIGNDTGNSPVDKLIERHYPGSDVKVITSVRGSTGCQYYRHQNRVQDYVTRYKPDLVMITAISHGYDVESVRAVVRQIRAQNEADIIVTSGPIGQDILMIEGYAKSQGVSLEEAAAVHRAFLRDLRHMAKEERVEFIPLRTLWNDYLGGPAKDHDVMWFMRDRTHANVRGRQVVARLLEKYFAPK
jgi:hypothetical protein